MSNSVANTCQIVLGTAALEYTREPVASHSTELFQKTQIVGVYPTAIQDKANLAANEDPNSWKYRFNKMIIVTVAMADGSSFRFDVQEVTNQPGWTADLAGQQQCIDDINAWL